MCGLVYTYWWRWNGCGLGTRTPVCGIPVLGTQASVIRYSHMRTLLGRCRESKLDGLSGSIKTGAWALRCTRDTATHPHAAEASPRFAMGHRVTCTRTKVARQAAARESTNLKQVQRFQGHDQQPSQRTRASLCAPCPPAPLPPTEGAVYQLLKQPICQPIHPCDSAVPAVLPTDLKDLP